MQKDAATWWVNMERLPRACAAAYASSWFVFCSTFVLVKMCSNMFKGLAGTTFVVHNRGVVTGDVLQELWKMVVHSLEKIVVLPPLTDPRAVSLSDSAYCASPAFYAGFCVSDISTLFAYASICQEVIAVKSRKFKSMRDLWGLKTIYSEMVIMLKCKVELKKQWQWCSWYCVGVCDMYLFHLLISFLFLVFYSLIFSSYLCSRLSWLFDGITRILKFFLVLCIFLQCDLFTCVCVCVLLFRSLQFQAMHRQRLKTCQGCCWPTSVRCPGSPSYIKSQLGQANRLLTLARNLQ